MYLDFVNALRTVGTGLILCSLAGIVAIIKSANKTKDMVNKCENCPYKTYYEQGYV